jgi:hypothetical protein
MKKCSNTTVLTEGSVSRRTLRWCGRDRGYLETICFLRCNFESRSSDNEPFGYCIHPYPAQAEGIRKAADTYRRTLLTSTSKNYWGCLPSFLEKGSWRGCV